MGENFDPIKELFTLGGKALDAYTARQAGAAFGDGPSYGVDEYGRVYQRGAPSAAFAGPVGSIDPRLLLLGAGLLAIGLVVYLAARS